MVEERVDLGKVVRAALYCRVSTEDQAKEGFSLSAQQERLKAYCMAKEWSVEEVYIDDGFSGRSDDRPAYKRMMNERGRWDVLVVMKMDRIHRNSKNFTLMMEDLKKNGKEFTSMQESFDTTTAMGRFVMDIIQRIAQLESEQIGERVYVGMMQKAKEGKGILGFNLPYGYRIDNGELVVIDEEAKIVREIFISYLKGNSLRRICGELSSNKVPTKKGSRSWDPKTVYRILCNPLYCGFHRWDGIVYKGTMTSVISEQVFLAVQDILHSRRPALKVDIPHSDRMIGTIG